LPAEFAGREDVADKVERFEIIFLEKIKELCGLAASGAKMNVRNPSRPVMIHGISRSSPESIRRETFPV